MDKKTIQIFRASNCGDIVPPATTIEIHEQIGDLEFSSARKFHYNQGVALADALLASLPGGTVDAMIAELMRRRASLFSVPL